MHDPDYRKKQLEIKVADNHANPLVLLRIKAEWNQEICAQHLGCTRHTIANWERYRTMPDDWFRGQIDYLAIEYEFPPIDWEEHARRVEEQKKK